MASNNGNPRLSRTLIVCLAIVLVGAVAIGIVFSTEPVAERVGASKRTPMLVDVIEVTREDHRPRIVAMGTVEAAEDVILRPRVSGQVVEHAPTFSPGGYVAAGEMLVRIDPSDYETILQQRRADLSQAIADLELEMGRQNIARLDFEVLDEELQGDSRALVLREPQLLAARARVDAARAAVRQAELDLDRTTVTAPFNAHILSREVNTGSQVSSGEALGRLVGLDTYWVTATVSRQALRWLEIPPSPKVASTVVQIRDRAAWPEDSRREGRLQSRIGSLEEGTRLARVLVTVDDPLARQDSTLPPLTLGAFVEAVIPAREIRDVVRLPRELVRTGNTVWVMQADTLQIRDAEIVFQDDAHAYVTEGLESGDLVVTTNLATVVSGAPLRLEGEER